LRDVRDFLRRTSEETTSHERAARFCDEETGGHVVRSGIESGLLAAAGWDTHRVEQFHLAAPMHDLGKIGIPDAILRKPGTLGPREAFAMQAHTLLAAISHPYNSE
jgi:putative two-component system response regulator